MLTKILAFLSAIGLGVIFRWMAIKGAKNEGKLQEQVDDAEADNETRAKARAVRDRMRTDTEYVQGVRDRFKSK